MSQQYQTLAARWAARMIKIDYPHKTGDLLEKYNQRMRDSWDLIKTYDPYLAACDSRAQNTVMRSIINGSYRYPVSHFLEQLARSDGGDIMPRMRGVGKTILQHLQCHVIDIPDAPLVDTPAPKDVVTKFWCELCGAACNTGRRFCSTRCANRAHARPQTSARKVQAVELFRQGKKCREVAEVLGVTKARAAQIRKRVIEQGLFVPSPPPPPVPKLARFCLVCGVELHRNQVKYCCGGHSRRLTKTCVVCNTSFRTKYKTQRCCSRRCGYTYRDHCRKGEKI